MPIPSPNDGESESDFMGRCMESLKDEDKPHDQKVAICMTTFRQKKKANESPKKTIFLEGTLKTKLSAKGKSLQITGVLLRPGTWVGLDGIPTKYSEEFISKVYESLPNTPIRFAHKISREPLTPEIPQGETVGYWTRSRNVKALQGRGYVFNPTAIRFLQEHPETKLSVEALVATVPNDDGSETAIDGYLTGAACIMDSACKTSTIDQMRTVTLERGLHMEHAKFNETGKNDQAEYLKFIETELAAKEVNAETIKTVVESLGKIDKPYEIPGPQITPPEPLPAEIAEFVEYAKGKPFADAIKNYAKEKFNANGEEIANLQAKLNEATTALNTRMLEDISSLTEEIKGLDAEFGKEKMLEGVTDLTVQRKLLQNHLDTLRKNTRPINLELTPEQKATAKVEKAAAEMFGDATITPEKLVGIQK